MKISSEHSAQRMSHPPNPALGSALLALTSNNYSIKKLGTVVDLGCGKLRHFKLLASKSKSLWLVDTARQLEMVHEDHGNIYTIPKEAELARQRGQRIYAMSFEEFCDKGPLADVIFCIAVFDVVSRQTRQALTHAAAQRLKRDGRFVIIAPRNDSSILLRCSSENAYQDGHVFKHHGIHTFFHNYKEYKSIVRDCTREGLTLISDLSRYRQVCLVFAPDTLNK